jgi:hypothetical protein
MNVIDTRVRAQRALRRLGESVEGELQRSVQAADVSSKVFRIFAYAFGLRYGGVANPEGR